jgi:Ca2+-binding RTX toxin-like protein
MAIITGTNGNDQYPHELEGTAGADQIFGLAGDDTLIGLSGDDLLEGGAGADELFGSAGFDTASYHGSDRGVYISLGTFAADGGHATGDTLYSIEGLIGSARTDYLYGSSERNVLQGGNGADLLSGREGDDLLAGGGGSDILLGDEGADELRGDGGVDFALYYASDQAVTVNLATGRGTGGDAQGDRFVGVEAVQGSSFADRLTGNAAANQLRGVDGADILTGGGGADRFFIDGSYGSSAIGPDQILDFSRAQGDRIVTGDGKDDVDGFQAFRFIGQADFTDVGQLRYYQEAGQTIIEGNTAVKEGAEMVIVLQGLFDPRATDFIFADIGFAPPIQA